MSEYIVSARKYRPMTFDTVVGQTALTTTLRNAVKTGKLAHAYLFCGPRGVGKTTCARIFAKAINCSSPTADGEACGHCESCKAFGEQRSFNIFELDAASNNSVENIKALMEQTRIPPQTGKYKVFIIDEVHMLSTQAFNAFLKTLEEPPSHVIFILATTEKQKILPTIISRCQIYDFERITVDGIVNHLKNVASKEGITCDDEALALIAEKADGGMRDALSMFDQAAAFCQGDITYAKVAADLNVLDADNYFKLTDLALDNDVAGMMVLLNDIIAHGFDGGRVINGLASHLRNVLMAKDGHTLKLLQASSRKTDMYKRQAARCPAKFIYKALRLLNDCDINYRDSSNKRLLVELTLIEMAQLTQDDEAAGAGRGPKMLKPLFNNNKANARNQAVSQAATMSVSQASATASTAVSAGNIGGKGNAASDGNSTAAHNGNAESADKGSVNGGNAPTAAKDNGSRHSGDASATPNAAPATSNNTSAQNGTPATPRAGKKLKAIGTSLAGIKGGAAKTATTASLSEANGAGNAPADTDDSRTFTDGDVQRQWLAYCSQMPAEMKGLAARMKNIVPKITSFPAIEAVADSQSLLDDMTPLKADMSKALADALHNSALTLTLRLAAAAEASKAMSRQEAYADLRRTNPSIDKLCASLDMEIA